MLQSKSKKHLSLILPLAMTMTFTAACGGNSGGGAAGESKPAAAGAAESGKEAAKTEGPVKVVYWHAMGGELGKAVDKLVADFNASQKDVVVEAVFQGTYDESLNKLKASMDSKSGPTLIQVYEIGSRFMIDSKAITPIQQFIDADKYDISQLEENILNYYKVDGKLYSMPFNTSNPILYYNKDLFKAAGLDPEKPPATYEEVAEAAKKLTKDGQAGASFAIYGWFMEQFFANQGAELLNNGNGRTSLATESLLASDAGVKTLTWWKGMIDDKSMMNLGRKTDDTKKAFAAGQIAMTLDSTASLRGIVSAAEGKFEVGTGFLPKPSDAKEGGVIVGGASNYIMNNKSEAEQKGAWAFIKFLADPKQQAYWHVNTGYFPITKKAYDEQLVKDNLTKYPQFKTAVDQLHQTKANLATQGAVMGIFPQARQLTEGAIEEVLNGKKAPKEALDAAAKEITAKIAEYNKTTAK
ncbi:family 1 extracellular solute-binding protein [Paenibacillus mucilaginosus 3016]|uniref:Family 1 extracellular solute-binding protein n=2 Tax=Paenibacillus mucilaginosus TaxID=61624 RepID=H6N990_9BACL|nr:ABC transporter substrate-binding protein [Paenibacillus mucilaginosus]AFC27836.1 family 1 extracellular solute-binding protein [Paenibacillus mucilaginosus 3016]AFH59990.2 ABC transporter substrate-binding protein [Paenibacillus mucilaginosus K02]WFA16706.1 ABC transporter substrate-binding protein [Paenibacillus mucilaginosus]